MAIEVNMPDEKIRTLIIWGLSHDYKRVLRTLRATVRQLVTARELYESRAVIGASANYLNRCDEIESFLDKMGNLLDKHKEHDLTPVLQSHTTVIEELMSGLIARADKLSAVVEAHGSSTAATSQPAAMLVKQTRRARQQMLDLWSMPFSQIQQKPIAFSVKRELWRILSDLQSVFTANHASIRDNVNVKVTTMLTIDRTLFTVAVSNIIANAVVHSKRGKDLLITISDNLDLPKDSDRKKECKYLKLSIADNGPGILEEEQEIIFELFRQGRQNAESEVGSGVGLTFAQLAMDLVGGSLLLESAEAKGTTFFLRFPMQVAP